MSTRVRSRQHGSTGCMDRMKHTRHGIAIGLPAFAATCILLLAVARRGGALVCLAGGERPLHLLERNGVYFTPVSKNTTSAGIGARRLPDRDAAACRASRSGPTRHRSGRIASGRGGSVGSRDCYFLISSSHLGLRAPQHLRKHILFALIVVGRRLVVKAVPARARQIHSKEGR